VLFVISVVNSPSPSPLGGLAALREILFFPRIRGLPNSTQANRLRMSGDAHPYPQQAISCDRIIPRLKTPQQVGRIVLNEPLFFRAFRAFRGS